MRIQLSIEGMSQYSDAVKPSYQNSACGPTTVHVILKYVTTDAHAVLSVNDLYKKLGGSKIGLFKWRLICNLRKILGTHWIIDNCTLKDALHELDEGRPVAMKFDQYFSFKWRAKPAYKYHWVPLIGYEIKNDQLYLIFHDNGGRYRESKVRLVPYSNNHKVLSFVRITPRHKSIST